MRELTIEEKAKRFDEAIKIAKSKIKNDKDHVLYEDDVLEIFPELKESEDEKIRKHLIKHFENKSKENWNGVPVKNILAYLKKQGEQKPVVKVESEFKIEEGKRYVCISQFCNCIEGRVYKAVSDSRIIDDLGTEYDMHSDAYKYFRLWTIEDAKDGDLIYVCTEEKGIQAIFHEYKNKTIFFHCYLCSDFAQGGYMPIGDVELAYPLQETHYKRFFEKMHEAGYEWDAEKKELNKIEQKPSDLPKGEDYGIDGLYNAIRILEKTLGKVDGYQTDDGILEHECAISAVKSMYEQKPAWSEEDEEIHRKCICAMRASACGFPEEEKFVEQVDNWLKSLKYRVQPKQEWSEEDRKSLEVVTNVFERYGVHLLGYPAFVHWLKKLPERISFNPYWKPSDEQIKVLAKASETYCGTDKGVLYSLYNDLKKLREE